MIYTVSLLKVETRSASSSGTGENGSGIGDSGALTARCFAFGGIVTGFSSRKRSCYRECIVGGIVVVVFRDGKLMLPRR